MRTYAHAHVRVYIIRNKGWESALPGYAQTLQCAVSILQGANTDAFEIEKLTWSKNQELLKGDDTMLL